MIWNSEKRKTKKDIIECKSERFKTFFYKIRPSNIKYASFLAKEKKEVISQEVRYLLKELGIFKESGAESGKGGEGECSDEYYDKDDQW